METRSILVNVDISNPDTNALRFAVDLASRTGASLIGLGADQPSTAYAGWTADGVAVDIYSMERTEIETQLERAQEAFNSLVPVNIPHAWRGYVTDRTRALVAVARSADVIVTQSSTTSTFHQEQITDLGSLVLSAGRPVIDVATTSASASFNKICIGWKDTREARRAVADALPFLNMAREVVALTVSEGERRVEQESLDDLLAWLKEHGVTARGDLIDNPHHYGDVLETNALSLGADLLVIGGYGHSRVREWFFGGVTRGVLAANSLNRLISN
jgi:nucleotide-binding universal stress UspA family protein